MGTHLSLDEAPHVPIFTRDPSAKPPTQSNTLTHAFTEMATSIASALQQPTNKPSVATGPSSSPGRMVEIRGKYIGQLRELHSLFEGGALNEQEFMEEKTCILQQMKMMYLSQH